MSIYVDMSENRRDSLVARVAAIADGLEALGTPTELVRTSTTPLLAPPPGRSAMAVLASSDDRVLVASSPDPLHEDVGEFGAVPRLGPAIEWSQQMITHAVVREVDGDRADVMVFGADGTTTSLPSLTAVDGAATAGDPAAADNAFGEFLTAHDPAAVFVVGGGLSAIWKSLQDLVLSEHLRPDCHLERLESGDDADVAEAVVRHTASVVATRKVRLLQDFRFELSHERAVEGFEGVVAAVNDGRVATLLLHDDPDDHRRAIVHPDGSMVAVPPDEIAAAGDGQEVRLADALICATLQRGGAPVILPSTGEKGPADDLGALLLPRPPAGLIDN
ncbi:MAG: hypothetical protein RIB98_07475 [Acidimicrobiales bacterium]